jgi:hypothetical protein
MADLPLPWNNPVGKAAPDTMAFSAGRFTYELHFDEEASTEDTLYHLAGTYRYEVDLAARTVSLTVLES